MIEGFKWVRPFMPERWIDGDTCEGVLDRGDRDYYRPKGGIRLLYGDGSKFDAPEKNKADQHDRAMLAWAQVKILVPEGTPVVTTCHRLDPDSFGRPLCSIKLADGRDLAVVMASLGHTK